MAKIWAPTKTIPFSYNSGQNWSVKVAPNDIEHYYFDDLRTPTWDVPLTHSNQWGMLSCKLSRKNIITTDNPLNNIGFNIGVETLNYCYVEYENNNFGFWVTNIAYINKDTIQVSLELDYWNHFKAYLLTLPTKTKLHITRKHFDIFVKDGSLYKINPATYFHDVLISTENVDVRFKPEFKTNFLDYDPIHSLYNNKPFPYSIPYNTLNIYDDIGYVTILGSYHSEADVPSTIKSQSRVGVYIDNEQAFYLYNCVKAQERVPLGDLKLNSKWSQFGVMTFSQGGQWDLSHKLGLNINQQPWTIIPYYDSVVKYDYPRQFGISNNPIQIFNNFIDNLKNHPADHMLWEITPIVNTNYTLVTYDNKYGIYSKGQESVIVDTTIGLSHNLNLVHTIKDVMNIYYTNTKANLYLPLSFIDIRELTKTSLLDKPTSDPSTHHNYTGYIFNDSSIQRRLLLRDSLNVKLSNLTLDDIKYLEPKIYFLNQYHLYFGLDHIVELENRILLNQVINTHNDVFSVNYTLSPVGVNAVLSYIDNSVQTKIQVNMPTILPTESSTYAEFMNRNANQFSLRSETIGINQALGFFGGVNNLVGSITSPTSSITGIVGSGLGMYAGQINSMLQQEQLNAQVKDMENVPNQVANITNETLKNVAFIENERLGKPEFSGFNIQIKELTDQSQETLIIFLRQFGYSCNIYLSLDRALQQSRKVFDFIQATNLKQCVQNVLPVVAIESIHIMFANGVQLWHITKSDSDIDSEPNIQTNL